MPQRAAGLVIALLGVLALAILLLVGADVYRAARGGPRWKRRLLGAGLLVLASLGFLPATSAAAEEKPKAVAPADEAGPHVNLDQRTDWQGIVEAWRDAAPVADGRRGAYPFNEAQKKGLLVRLAGVDGRIDTLLRDGLLSEAEGGLLKSELCRLVEGVEDKRPVEMRGATCYWPMTTAPAHYSLKRLQERLPLLEKMAVARAVKSEVVAKALGTVEDDLEILGNAKEIEPLKEAERAEAKKIRDAGQAALAKIQAAARGTDTSLAQSSAWRAVTDGMAAVAPLAQSGKSTEQERQAADGQLKAAEAAADKLTAEGLLAWPEAEILKAEMQKLRGEMVRNPPTDTKLVCYGAAQFHPPAQQSIERLTDRLPLLQKMIASGKITPEVLARVLPTIEADVKTLSDEKALGQLDKDRQAEARSSLRPRAEEILKQVKSLPR